LVPCQPGGERFLRLQAREGIINKRTVVLVSPGKKEKKARLSQKKKK
jgi:hypothetical protein